MPTVTPPVEVVRESGRATTLLQHPLRLRMLRALKDPDSATGLARRLGQRRQVVNYHLRELEAAGFVTLQEVRQRRGVQERVMRPSASSLVISPEALDEMGSDPGEMQDRFSWAYLVASAARVIRDLGILRERADAVGKRLPTLTIEAEISFATATARQAFTEELQAEVQRLVRRYHNPQAAEPRHFRLLVGAYPKITKTDDDADAEAAAASQGIRELS